MREGGGRSKSGASCRAEGIQPSHASRGVTVCGSVHVVAGVTVPATGWLWRIEIWHWSQHSREENAGPDEWCDLRQQLALLVLQQQGASPASEEANASAGMG